MENKRNSLFSLFIWLLLMSKIYNFVLCTTPPCKKGLFRLENMTECHPWLTCKDIENMELGDLIGYGAVKQVYRTQWGQNIVAYNVINNKKYIQDFHDGLQNLKEFGPSECIVQLIGFCTERNVFITEFHHLGNVLNSYSSLSEKLDLEDKFLFCIKYVKILTFLHDSPIGKRVMCDSSTLNKTLEQYLLTNSLNLVLNDVDALPEVSEEGIVCGHKELHGPFVAPEQKWPYAGEKFQRRKMIPYDEKSDIWKIADVCNYFIGSDEMAKAFRYQLHPIHQKCRHKNPDLRPSATQVLEYYKSVFHEYFQERVLIVREEL